MVSPIARFKARPVVASVFARTVGENGQDSFVAYSVSLQRAYRAASGGVEYTSSLDLEDLPKAILVLNKAYEYLSLEAGVRGESS